MQLYTDVHAQCIFCYLLHLFGTSFQLSQQSIICSAPALVQNTNNNSLEDRILNNFGGAIENELIHTIGNADEQLDELNMMTRSSYIDTADLKDTLASTTEYRQDGMVGEECQE